MKKRIRERNDKISKKEIKKKINYRKKNEERNWEKK